MNLSRFFVGAAWLAPALFLLEGALCAEVVRVRVDRRVDVLNGRSFGSVGPYEMVEGRISYALRPDNPHNQAIVDIGVAPRNSKGEVEAQGDVLVLQAKDPSKRRGVALVEVSNRGRKAVFQYLNMADYRAPDPHSAADFGDGFLMDEGITIVILGWQFDVRSPHGMVLSVPVVKGQNGPITGLVRSDWTMDKAEDQVMLGHLGHWNYPPSQADDPADVLTIRNAREGKRTAIPREDWQYVSTQASSQMDAIRIKGGFQPGHIYELVYHSQDPRLVGMGLSAVRDVASYIKYNPESLFPAPKAIAFGFSQTGRFLRHFLYQGFNTDEQDRKVYDGMLIQVAGAGRGSFNHRFAQPSRDGTPYLSLFYPTDLFPFTSRMERDPATGAEDGVFVHQRQDHMPLIFQSNTSYEYWGRAASLIHTSPDGLHDVPPQPNERIYLLTGAQHMIEWLIPAAGDRMGDSPAYRGNEVDFRLTFRALALHMIRWVKDGMEPPPSRYPTIGAGTLVPAAGLAFPRIPGMEIAKMPHVAYPSDYGAEFFTRGIITKEPPVIGPAYRSLVPQVDGLGNDLGGIRPYELRVPLATNTGWNLRDAPWNTGEHAKTGEDALTSYLGTYMPLPRTEAERRATGDPRPSVEALYGTKDRFLARVREAAAQLVSAGFLLERDVPLVEHRASERWDWVMGPRTNTKPIISVSSN